MATITVRRLANATWLIALVYMVAQWLVALRFGLFAATATTLALAIAGLIAGIICLRQASRGTKGILIPAVVGLILNTVLIVAGVPTIMRASERRHAVAQTGAVSNPSSSETVFRYVDVPDTTV
jgi:hypothetical protein